LYEIEINMVLATTIGEKLTMAGMKIVSCNMGHALKLHAIWIVFGSVLAYPV